MILIKGGMCPLARAIQLSNEGWEGPIRGQPVSSPGLQFITRFSFSLESSLFKLVLGGVVWWSAIKWTTKFVSYKDAQLYELLFYSESLMHHEKQSSLGLSHVVPRIEEGIPWHRYTAIVTAYDNDTMPCVKTFTHGVILLPQWWCTHVICCCIRFCILI